MSAPLTRRAALAGGAGLIAATAATAVSCQPVEAPAAEPFDPLLEAVLDYIAAYDAWEPLGGLDDEDFEAHYHANVEPHYRRLKYETPTATTAAGALAALRLAWEEMQHAHGSFEEPLIAAALAFFDGRVA